MPGIAGIVVIIIVALYIINSIKILAEYERGVIFRLGRLLGVPKGPGIILVFAPIDRIVRVSLRQEALEVPPQDIITRDNVTLKVNAVIFLRVIDPNKAVVAVSNYMYQTSQFAQTTLRSVLGEVDLDELLAHREKINLRLQSILDQHTDPWGVKVTNVEVKQVDLPETMTRAMAKQAEAEREKRSKIIHAEGEFAAAQRLDRRRALAGPGADEYSAALFADADRDRRGEEYDHHLPGAGGSASRAAEAGECGHGEVERSAASGGKVSTGSAALQRRGWQERRQFCRDGHRR